MSQSFKVNVNKTLDINITKEDITNLDSIETSDSKFHILHQNKSYLSEIIEADFHKKSYRVKLNNNTYNINIINDLDVLIKEMGFEAGSSKIINEIKAPMPGLILDINVEVGQNIDENDALLILEAMKMENVLSSPRSGVIKSISVSKGDAVEKNQLLIEFEEA